MNLIELLPRYLKEQYGEQSIAVEHGYDGEFKVHIFVSELEFYWAVIHHQWDLYKGGNLLATCDDAVEFSERVVNLTSGELRDNLIKRLIKSDRGSSFWRDRFK